MNDQEIFWQKKFGDDYIERNKDKNLLSAKISLFSNILKRCSKIENVIEFGANIGLNLKAINLLLPNANLHAVEINKKAVEILKSESLCSVTNCSIKKFKPKKQFDLTFTKGVLIHINPNDLADTYEVIYKSSKKYILFVEYFNDEPIHKKYRGFENKLFKRDFCKEFLDIYDDIKLLDYGFIYKFDYNFPLDNFNWFLMEKIKDL